MSWETDKHQSKLGSYHASMIRESLLPSEVAAGTTTLTASAFLGAFVLFTAGVSALLEAVAVFLLGAILEQAARRADAALSCNLSCSKAENGWTLLAQDSSILCSELWNVEERTDDGGT